MPVTTAKRLNCSSTARPISACTTQEHKRLRHAHLSRGYRPRPRPFDHGIEIAVGDVVPGAARAAHGKGADEEQRDDRAAIGRARGRCRRRARPTTSTASATARNRSDGRDGRAADKAATTTARGYRPSCRSHRQHGPPRRSSRRRSSREHVAVQRIEGAAALLGRGGLRQRRRRAQHLAQARAGRASASAPAAPTSQTFFCIASVFLWPAFSCFGDLRRDPALRGVGSRHI